VFSKPIIKDLLSRYALVQLYTDRVPPQYEPTTTADQNRTAQLPLYVIVKPLGDGKYEEVGRYDEGKINSITAFGDFLRRHLSSGEMTQVKTDGI
jgi:hypothetical protein